MEKILVVFSYGQVLTLSVFGDKLEKENVNIINNIIQSTFGNYNLIQPYDNGFGFFIWEGNIDSDALKITDLYNGSWRILNYDEKLFLSDYLICSSDDDKLDLKDFFVEFENYNKTVEDPVGDWIDKNKFYLEKNYPNHWIALNVNKSSLEEQIICVSSDGEEWNNKLNALAADEREKISLVFHTSQFICATPCVPIFNAIS